MKQKITNAVLWIAYLLALAASLSHVAATFNRFERPNQQYGGWLAAIAVDAGLAALAYALHQRRRARRSAISLQAGVVSFAAISAYANALHALAVSPSTLFSAIVFSSTLPLLVVYLGEIVSSDDASIADHAERERMRQERMDARKAEEDARREAALQAQAKADTEAMRRDAPHPLSICAHCGASFESSSKLAAHVRWTHARKNGHTEPKPEMEIEK